MKKLLFISFVLLSFLISAQNYTLFNQEAGTNINDGDIITVGPSTPPVTTHVIFTNNETFPVKATLEATNIVNTDGSEISFCFGFDSLGSCYDGIDDNTVYQSVGTLNPGASTGTSDIDFTHIDGYNGANFPNYPKDYVIKITVYNANDNSLVGSTTFTYRYDPNAQAVNSFNKDEISISTGYHVLNIVSKYQTEVTLYNLTGQKVKEVRLKPNQNHIYTGNMAPGIYLVHVTAEGKEIYKKVVLK